LAVLLQKSEIAEMEIVCIYEGTLRDEIAPSDFVPINLNKIAYRAKGLLINFKTNF
jgi:hypothetical protein